MSEQDPAALVARARKLADWLRKMDDVSDDAALLDDLASALSAALAREARLRKALAGMLETSDGFDFDQLCKRHDATVVNRIMRARAALEPEDAG